MRNYIVTVRDKNAESYSHPLTCRTNDLDEVVEIFDMMLRYGHTVTVEVEETLDPEDEEADEKETTLVKVVIREPRNPQHSKSFSCPCVDDGR